MTPRRLQFGRKSSSSTRADRTAHDQITWTHTATISLLRDEDAEAFVERRSRLSRIQRALKRTLDLVAALVLLLVLAPVMGLIALAIKLDSPGPVLFAHRRLGRGGRHFDCYKFRSMRQDAEHLLHADEALRHEYVTHSFKIPMAVDPRVTTLGRFLRRSSLDELPQLWNVLRGDMSLVGPRPIVALEGNHYGERLPDLLSVRPGLTGVWAVQGRSQIGYPERVDLELSYVERQSLLMDLQILARTPVTVFMQKGAI